MSVAEVFAVLAGAHVAFQLTVTLVVYPALADVSATRWAQAHADHSRRITYVVGLLYPALLAAGAWLLLDGPHGWGTWVALGGTALTVGATAAVAAPTHGRLGAGRDDVLIARLLLADRVRTLGAIIALVGALALL